METNESAIARVVRELDEAYKDIKIRRKIVNNLAMNLATERYVGKVISDKYGTVKSFRHVREIKSVSYVPAERHFNVRMMCDSLVMGMKHSENDHVGCIYPDMHEFFCMKLDGSLVGSDKVVNMNLSEIMTALDNEFLDRDGNAFYIGCNVIIENDGKEEDGWIIDFDPETGDVTVCVDGGSPEGMKMKTDKLKLDIEDE